MLIVYVMCTIYIPIDFSYLCAIVSVLNLCIGVDDVPDQYMRDRFGVDDFPNQIDDKYWYRRKV